MAVRSARNFVGYWENDEETAATLRDGWLYTGDLVRCDADGYFWFMGRKRRSSSGVARTSLPRKWRTRSTSILQFCKPELSANLIRSMANKWSRL